MKPLFRLPALLAGVGLLTMAGCKSPSADAAKPPPASVASAKKRPVIPTIPDQNGDVNFQAFLGRLRHAIAAHDLQTIASMMTTDFGYRLEPPGEGDGVFAFWDQNNVWPELELIMREDFVPKENYMVAPAEFLADETHYSGYRAGIRLDNGAWKFAYFVSGQ